MSEDISVANTTTSETEAQSSKRRRRSGWDIQTPADIPPPVGISYNVSPLSSSAVNTSSSSGFVQPVSLQDPAYLLQQAQLAQVAQQSLLNQQLQLAQQQALLIQNRALNPLLGGMGAQLPKQGCRIYVGYCTIVFSYYDHHVMS